MANEKRLLIYYDELVMRLAKTYGDTMDTHIYSPRDILSSMQGLRPVDAVEVVHGRWDKNWSGDNIVYCDQCYMPQDIPTPYCHSCGAKMDGEWKDNV